MTKYIFEPQDLQRIVQMHLDAPLSERFERIAETLKAVYGDHVHTGQEWIVHFNCQLCWYFMPTFYCKHLKYRIRCNNRITKILRAYLLKEMTT